MGHSYLSAARLGVGPGSMGHTFSGPAGHGLHVLSKPLSPGGHHVHLLDGDRPPGTGPEGGQVGGQYKIGQDQRANRNIHQEYGLPGGNIQNPAAHGRRHKAAPPGGLEKAEKDQQVNVGRNGEEQGAERKNRHAALEDTLPLFEY